MRFIISPAKKMISSNDGFLCRDIPACIHDSEELLTTLRTLSYDELKGLWKCSDALVTLNQQRLKEMDLFDSLTPALFAYEGIQYQNMAPQVLTGEELEYMQEHVRILSGFYGVLKPFDGVRAYRLEMQAKLSVGSYETLYQFWGRRLYDCLARECSTIINLASVEYSKAILPWAEDDSDMTVVTCLFGKIKQGKFVQQSTHAKAARGSFVRWCAQNEISSVDDMRAFDVMGLLYNERLSDEKTLVFSCDE